MYKGYPKWNRNINIILKIIFQKNVLPLNSFYYMDNLFDPKGN
jgi:hypothetical protein